MPTPASRRCPTKETCPKSTSAHRTVEQFVAARLGILAPVVQEWRLHKILQMVESGSLCTIRNLAVELNLSPSHLQHMFKQQTGTRLGHWLTDQRLKRAA